MLNNCSCPTFKLQVSLDANNGSAGAPVLAECSTAETEDHSYASEAGYCTIVANPFDLKLVRREVKSEMKADLYDSSGDDKKETSFEGDLKFSQTLSSPLEFVWNGTIGLLIGDKANPESASGDEGVATGNISANWTAYGTELRY